MPVNNYVYIVECADGSLYTGWTVNITKRLSQHNEGTGAKYTRGRRPVRLVHLEIYASMNEAMKRESAIKKLTRAQKMKICEETAMYGTCHVTTESQ